MNFGEFKELLGSQLRRTADGFAVGDTRNLLGIATNLAKNAAQSKYTFYHNAKPGYIEVPTTGVDFKTQTLDAKGGSAMEKVQTIIRAFEYTPDGPGTLLEQVTVERDVQWKSCLGGYIYLRNMNLYYRPVGTNTVSSHELILDVNQWRPDYVDDTDTDFFLDEGSEWMLYKAMTILQLRIKEDVRLAITQRMLNDAWNNLIRWDRGVDMDQEDGIDL